MTFANTIRHRTNIATLYENIASARKAAQLVQPDTSLDTWLSGYIAGLTDAVHVVGGT